MGGAVRERSEVEQERTPVLFTPAEWRVLEIRFSLTPRQAQICKLICEGQADKNIAAALEITLDTVRMHLREVFRKLGVQTRVSVILKLVFADRAAQAPEPEQTGSGETGSTGTGGE